MQAILYSPLPARIQALLEAVRKENLGTGKSTYRLDGKR